MPRLPPSLLHRAQRISPLAAVLLPACRDLPSALNELRWIREHVNASSAAPRSRAAAAAHQQLWRLCRRRGSGEPLQYVLGTQPFGDLEIKCRKGVLIPRPEPEAYTVHLASLLRSCLLPRAGTSALRVLDLCTGSGCIALLLYALLRPVFADLSVVGLDISTRAVRLARENAAHNHLHLPLSAAPATTGTAPAPAGQQTVRFLRGDMFADSWLGHLTAAAVDGPAVDVLTCNPPYVSEEGFARDTARSVRNYEPRRAQVPEGGRRGATATGGGGGATTAPEDVFYARLLDVAQRLGPRVVLCEVGGLEQARRVVAMALRHPFCLRGGGAGVRVEIWADAPDGRREPGEAAAVVVGGDEGGREIPVMGSGHGRSVFIYRGEEDGPNVRV